MSDLLLNMHLQLRISTIKMPSQKLKVFKAARFILNDYKSDISASKMLKEPNLDSTELRCKVKTYAFHHIKKTFSQRQMP